MKFRQVQYFLMVANAGSFTLAADELYISQSSLSKQIIALEKELGLPLFDRSRRKITLTQAGETFLKHASNLNAAYLAMVADLSAYKTKPSFSILSIPVIAQYDITSYLAQFKKAYPYFHYTLEEREPISIFRALTSHSHDLAFVRDNYLDTELYTSMVIAQDKLLVAVSQNHRFADRNSLFLNELANENFIIYDKSTLVDQVVLDACHKVGFEPRVIYTSLRIESILGQVSSNSGIALVMERLFNHSRHHGVVGIPLEKIIRSNVVLVWLRDKQMSRSARVFIDYMRKTVNA